MINPTTTAPTSEPTNAPTIPPQKRSGRKIVKCQIARPIITQPSMPISATPHAYAGTPGLHEGLALEELAPRGQARAEPASAAFSSRPPVPAVARTPATSLGARLGLFLEHQVLRSQVRRRVALGGTLALGRRRAVAVRRPRPIRALRHARATALARLLRSVDVQVLDHLAELVPGHLRTRLRGRDQAAARRAL